VNLDQEDRAVTGDNLDQLEKREKLDQMVVKDHVDNQYKADPLVKEEPIVKEALSVKQVIYTYSFVVFTLLYI